MLGESLEGFALRRIADDERRLGIADEIVELGGRVGGVERQEDGAGPHAAEIEKQRLGRFFDLHRDPVAGRDAQPVSAWAKRALPASMSP